MVWSFFVGKSYEGKERADCVWMIGGYVLWGASRAALQSGEVMGSDVDEFDVREKEKLLFKDRKLDSDYSLIQVYKSKNTDAAAGKKVLRKAQILTAPLCQENLGMSAASKACQQHVKQYLKMHSY